MFKSHSCRIYYLISSAVLWFTSVYFLYINNELLNILELSEPGNDNDPFIGIGDTTWIWAVLLIGTPVLLIFWIALSRGMPNKICLFSREIPKKIRLTYLTIIIAEVFCIIQLIQNAYETSRNASQLSIGFLVLSILWFIQIDLTRFIASRKQ